MSVFPVLVKRGWRRTAFAAVMAAGATIEATASDSASTSSLARRDAEVISTIRKNYKEAALPPSLIALAPGAVKPDGWLRDWAETSAKGYVRSLDERSNVFKLGWTGEPFESKGSDGHGLGWPLEQSAYWLDGLVRLAYILDDEEMKQKAHTRLDKLVDEVNKGADTFIWWESVDVVKIPDGNPKLKQFTRLFNNWAHSHIGRAMVAYYRASGDKEILDALRKVYADFPIYGMPLEQFEPHGSSTNLDPLFDTYAMSGDKAVLQNGVDHAEGTTFTKIVNKWANEELPSGHTVLYYEHSRIPAISATWTGDTEAMKASRKLLERGLELHGQPVGLTSGHEYLMGKGPLRAIETCIAAASGWTNKWMLQLTGEQKFADRMEKGLFNLGAAAVSRDFDTACYFQTLNKIDKVLPVHVLENIEGYDYTKTAGPTFCCIGNSTRMIPDYIQHMWMATMDNGLAATLYGPNNLHTTAGDGTEVGIVSETKYPFGSGISMTVSPDSPVDFPIYLRIPGWCKAPKISLNGEAVDAPADDDGFVKLQREWKAGDKIQLEFPMEVVVEREVTTQIPDIEYFKKPHRATPITKVKHAGRPYASVHYGPLLFALAQEDVTPNEAKEGQKWQYALDVNPAEVKSAIEVIESDMPDNFHWQLDAPLKLKVPARFFDWKASNTHPLPDEPVKGGEEETITLVPYGTTKFRVSMFPVTEKLAGETKSSDEKTSAPGR